MVVDKRMFARGRVHLVALTLRGGVRESGESNAEGAEQGKHMAGLPCYL